MPVFQEYIAENCSVPYTFAPAHVNKQRAGAVAALGMKYFAEGRSETAAEHKPEYLRLSQAERTKRGRISMITVRAMQVKDAEQVSELERMIFSQPWSYQDLWIHSVCRTRFFWLRKKIIRSLGYIGMYLSIDEGEITNVAVSPEMRCHGIGGMLLAEAKRGREPLGRQNRARSPLFE